MRVTTLAARTAYALATIAVAVTVAFVGIRVLPGNALRAQQVESGSNAVFQPADDAYADLNEPVVIQYVTYVSRLMRGDLGVSLYSGRSVSVLIGERLSSTVTLASMSLLLTTVWIVIAAACASVPRLRPAIDLVCVVGSAAPTFITGTLAIAVLGIPSPSSVENVVAAAAVLSLYVAATIVIPLLANIVDLERRSFVTTAHGKGLPPRRVFWIHIMPNAIRPLMGLIAVQIGFLLSGTVVTEVLFTRGGIGRLMIDSVMRRDYPVVQGLVLYVASLYVIAQMIARSLSDRDESGHFDA